MMKVTFLIANTLVDTTYNNDGLPVRALNISMDEILLKKGATLGVIHEVAGSVPFEDTEDQKTNHIETSLKLNRVGNRNSLPCHLQDLFDRSAKTLTEEEQQKLFKLLSENAGLFAKSSSELGQISIVEHSIDTNETRPIKQSPRRPPRAFVNKEEEIIQEQLKAGVIRESSSPWASPMVYVLKKDGTIRPCVDYRKLNDVTLKDAYPLPRINDCLDSLGNANFLSTLDLQSGYWQVRVREEDKPKTAFVTRSGLYEYNKMAMGLCNAPSTFQRCMELVFRGLQWKILLIYLDDIIVFSENVLNLI